MLTLYDRATNTAHICGHLISLVFYGVPRGKYTILICRFVTCSLAMLHWLCFTRHASLAKLHSLCFTVYYCVKAIKRK